MTEQLKDLERRLAEATGPSRELDALIALAIDDAGNGFLPAPNAPGCVIDRAGRVSGPIPISHYTSSTDSAVSLASRVLPGWSIDLSIVPDGICSASMYGKSDAPAPALALCTAIVRALMQKEG